MSEIILEREIEVDGSSIWIIADWKRIPEGFDDIDEPPGGIYSYQRNTTWNYCVKRFCLCSNKTRNEKGI